MFGRKVLVVAVVMLAVMCVPSWSTQFRRRVISDQQFIDMCQKGDTAGVIRAIKAGVDVNAKENDGQTALMYAAMKGHSRIVNALLRA